MMRSFNGVDASVAAFVGGVLERLEDTERYSVDTFFALLNGVSLILYFLFFLIEEIEKIEN